MDMFGGLTKTSSRIAIAAALGMTLGGFAMSATPAKAADLEERVAELEATTVRKGNKKVSVTLSGWVVKLGTWWDDGHETNFYVGDKDTTLSSHFQISGSAQIAPGWSGGYTIAIETPGTSCSAGFVENQFNDNLCANGDINTLLSYMWLKSDKWGTVNWGQLSQATDNVALLPDLSGTVIESNAVLFDGAGMFLRPRGVRNSNDLNSGDFVWGNVVQCLVNGGGVGADCAGYPYNGVRYDTATYGGFSVSGGYYEDDVWDVAVKYAADWNSIKVSAAAGYTQITDEGCSVGGSANNFPQAPGQDNPTGQAKCGGVVTGGGGAPHQDFRRDGSVAQVGASIMHVPSGLFAYGLYQHENNDGTQWTVENPIKDRFKNAENNDTDVWFAKAGIKKAWFPAGATVIWGEGGQYLHQFAGLCANPSGSDDSCEAFIPVGTFKNGDAILNQVQINDSTVNRWGIGVVQEIDSAAMHLFARWQHLSLDLSATCDDSACGPNGKTKFGAKFSPSFEDLDLFQVGGVIFF